MAELQVNVTKHSTLIGPQVRLTNPSPLSALLTRVFAGMVFAGTLGSLAWLKRASVSYTHTFSRALPASFSFIRFFLSHF